jgi:hypothetical protein
VRKFRGLRLAAELGTRNSGGRAGKVPKTSVNGSGDQEVSWYQGQGQEGARDGTEGKHTERFQPASFCEVFYYSGFCLWDWGLNSEFPISKAGILPLEPHLQFILLWLFWRWGSQEVLAWSGLKP